MDKELEAEKIREIRKPHSCNCDICSERMIMKALHVLRPPNATGVYLTQMGIKYGALTSQTGEFPENFLELWPKKDKEN